VEPGTCGDHDGDGLIGHAEDEDLDNNFGTIGAALAAVADNGTVTVVEDGTYPEAVRLRPVEGASVTLQGAEGVTATIDAVVQGQAGNAERADQPGVYIKGCGACRVTMRNVTVRNFARGVTVHGASRVLLDRVRADGNLHFGIKVVDQARVAVRGAVVTANGFRKDSAGVAEARPGTGIFIARNAGASIVSSTVSSNRAAGIKARREDVTIRRTQVFGNDPNYALR
jgi:hypothetical protein